MTADTTPPGDSPRPAYAVDALIAKAKPGRSVRQIERDADLREGALGHYLKPAQRGKIPKIKVIERFAAALDVDFEEMADAFAADSYIPGRTGPDSDDEHELVTLYRSLPATERPLARRLLRTLVQEHTERLRQVSGRPERRADVPTTTT
ncbi:hypothetical protein ALI22I_23255 [Saccharothrix sp. ALI-22-I]|uniref:hypothetical protein n=1 Tax=Saccharothrix sp. ALI-22-I TaxID=1933778 RepID=UPI00097C0BAE|nr:hypothetical protein [Saccharothrix sp. ALI-22-I]ONI87342.1 hypothetical protein ALI22I_23255 [Saccharothrix sp. ALI-22-I]